MVVKSTGRAQNATSRYARELFDDWQSQASRSGRSFDAERSVIIVTGLENKQVAVHPGATLRNRFGLSARTVEGELIQRIFIPLAEEGKYPEAISALLDATNQWIAARDSKTAAIPVTGVTAKPSSSAWFPTIVLGVVVLAIGLIGLVWAWVVHRRSRDRVGARLKEIKSQAVEVMDRLDGLKERLKLLPTAPGFSQAMSGETLDLYNTVQAKVGKLWDGWLAVMEVLDKAQKLAARSGSLLSQKTLGEAEELIDAAGIVRGDREQSPGHQHRHRPPRPRTPGGPGGSRNDHHGSAQDRRRRSRRSRRSNLPTSPYQQELDARGCGHDSGEPRCSPPIRWEPRPSWNSFRLGPRVCRAGSNALSLSFRMPGRSRRRWSRSGARRPATGRRA